MTRRIPDDERKERSTLASNVVKARTALGLEAEDLAHEAGMSVQAILNIESGKTLRPHGSNLRRIAEVLNTTPDKLLGEVSREELEELIAREGAENRKEIRRLERKIQRLIDELGSA